MYNIQPINVGFGTLIKQATKISFQYGYTANMTQMPFVATYMDDDLNILASLQMMVDSQTLAGWGSDDSYIINAMANIAQVTITGQV